jgi:DNA-directed RNA polymerase subunit beta'
MPQTFGQLLVNDLLPRDLQTTKALDKKGLHQRLYTLARRDPGEAARTMDNIRQLGHEIATTEGASISLKDITPNYKARNAALKPALRSLQKVSDPTRRKEIILDAQSKLQKSIPKFGGTQGMMVQSGTRGKPVQLMRSFMAPVAARDAQGNPHPWLVHHSYSEGLRPSEHWATSIESRNNLMAANLAVREPGDFSKILVNNMGDQLVLDEECGTKNGIAMNTDDTNMVDRFLAKSVAGLKVGTQVTPQVLSQLKKKAKTAIVRSPMTCEHTDGVCQKCFGLNEKGTLHSIGTNIGIRSAQAITEPLTQFTLSARHGVRQAGSDASKIKGLKGLRQFLEMPSTFSNKAILSDVDGKVDRIQKAPQGGYNITVGGTTQYAPPDVSPSVRKGQKVAVGDVLTSGVPKPDELVRYKGLGAGRQYMTQQLHDTYKAQGADVDKRHFEILARAHLNHVQIDEDPEDRFYPGEVVNYNVMLKELAKDTTKEPLKKAKGQMLAKGYLHHTAGTTVTSEMVKDLSKNGISRVRIARNPPKVSFIAQSITSNPLLNPNWMARLGHRRLKQTALEAAQFGEEADIHGTHPVPGFVYGAEFGKGPKGQY